MIPKLQELFQYLELVMINTWVTIDLFHFSLVLLNTRQDYVYRAFGILTNKLYTS